MAKVKNPLLSLAAYGGLAKSLVFRRQGKDTQAQLKTRPTDRQSFAQLEWRTMYQKACALWHLLSPAEMASWESQARPLHMTGFAYFISQALRPNPGIYLPLAGGTMQGTIAMDTNTITGLPAPTLPDEPARLADIYLPTLISADNFIMIPTVAGWTEVFVGAGAAQQQPTRQVALILDANAGSALLHTPAYGFNIGGDYQKVNFDKHLYIIFNYGVYKTEANLIRRVQLKKAAALGVLAEIGLGIEIDNTTITGEAYGTARGTVALGSITMLGTLCESIQVIIWLDPDTPAVRYYIDGSLAGSITNTNHIPAGEATGAVYFNHSIYRPAGGLAVVGSIWLQGKMWGEL